MRDLRRIWILIVLLSSINVFGQGGVHTDITREDTTDTTVEDIMHLDEHYNINEVRVDDVFIFRNGKWVKWEEGMEDESPQVAGDILHDEPKPEPEAVSESGNPFAVNVANQREVQEQKIIATPQTQINKIPEVQRAKPVEVQQVNVQKQANTQSNASKSSSTRASSSSKSKSTKSRSSYYKKTRMKKQKRKRAPKKKGKRCYRF